MKLKHLAFAGALMLPACGGEAPVMSEQAERGQAHFAAQCGACHQVDSPSNYPAPNLVAVIGRPAGSEAFGYSEVLQNADFLWTEAQMDAFLERPREILPGNQMAFYGIPEQDVRDDLVAYLVFATN